VKSVYLRAFVKKFDSFSAKEQASILATIEDTLTFFRRREVPHGLRIKKLSTNIYEARINIHLRIAFFADKDVLKFFCLGNHDDIKRMLKTLKSRVF
jgi:hypothetical protein